jgi:hypothetical protein
MLTCDVHVVPLPFADYYFTEQLILSHYFTEWTTQSACWRIASVQKHGQDITPKKAINIDIVMVLSV